MNTTSTGIKKDSLNKVFLTKEIIDEIISDYPEAIKNRKYIFDYSSLFNN